MAVRHLKQVLVDHIFYVLHRSLISAAYLKSKKRVIGIPTYRAILYLMIAFAVIPTVSFNVHNVYKVVQARKGSMPLALAMLYPFIVLLGGVLVWDYLSPSDIVRNYPHLVIIGTGLAFGFLVGPLVQKSSGRWTIKCGQSAYCSNKCRDRCSKAGVQDRCLKYCAVCYEECKCDPSGTYGNKHGYSAIQHNLYNVVAKKL